MDDAQAEIAALKIILANVVARLAITLDRGGDGQIREVLAGMNDECKLAAEHATLTHIDEFFKGITITCQARVAAARTFHGPWKDFHGTVPSRLHDGSGVIHHSAGWSRGARAGAMWNAAGRRKRKQSGVSRTSRSRMSGATTATAVTIAETSPTSSIAPLFSSTARVAAIGRKKAR